VPEGDTIHRTAATLRAAVGGAVLRGFSAPRLPGPLPAAGATIGPVEARGKHLLVGFSATPGREPLVLHTHMRMTGSWHTYAHGQPWQRGEGTARVVLTTDDVVAVCFRAPVVEVLDVPSLRRHPVLRRLGPDLTVPGVDLDEVVARMERLAMADTTVGEVLLDQRVACGIGNVYRSEVCFLHGVDPDTPLGHVDRATRRALVATAADLLVANVSRTWRTTVPGAAAGTLWVYGRDGRPCRRCGTTIERSRLGDDNRVVHRCPTCQPPWRNR
jgi:endonuclease VIII